MALINRSLFSESYNDAVADCAIKKLFPATEPVLALTYGYVELVLGQVLLPDS